MYLDMRALRLMVVDDNKHMRTIIGSVLSAAGIGALHYAPNGREALKLLKQTPVDIAFVDYEMPVMNGLEFIRAVRHLETEERFMPIIMLSGYSDMQRVNTAVNHGVTEFLRKPVTARDILMRLQAAVIYPRQFVSAGDFIGPDRRRRRGDGYSGPRRRAADTEARHEI